MLAEKFIKSNKIFFMTRRTVNRENNLLKISVKFGNNFRVSLRDNIRIIFKRSATERAQNQNIRPVMSRNRQNMPPALFVYLEKFLVGDVNRFR